MNRIYQNVGSGNQTGMELVFSQDISSNWELSGSVNWYENVIDADRVTLLFPIARPFDVAYSKNDTWDLTLNNLITFTNGTRLQLTAAYYGERNIAQGTQAARSFIDVAFTKPVFDGRGEFVVSVTDLFNNFGIRQQIDGAGFDAVYENFYETQVVSVGLNYEFR